MVKNPILLRRLNRKLSRKEKIPYSSALRIYEALYREACRLGVFSSKNILDGLEVDIRIAKILNELK